jgi:hypothetical protein
VNKSELQNHRLFFLELTDIWRDYIPDSNIKSLVEQKAMELIVEIERLQNEIKSHAPEGRNYTNGQYVELLLEREKFKQALTDIVNIPPCECGDRKQGFDCMCGAYNAHEIAENALRVNNNEDN